MPDPIHAKGKALERELTQFFRDMARLFVTDRLDIINGFYDFPCAFVRPHETCVVAGPEQMQQIAKEVRDSYMARDLAAVLPEITQHSIHAPGLIVAELAFSYIDRDGALIAGLFSTYILRRGPSGLRIATHISHNEYADRRAYEAALSAKIKEPQHG